MLENPSSELSRDIGAAGSGRGWARAVRDAGGVAKATAMRVRVEPRPVRGIDRANHLDSRETAAARPAATRGSAQVERAQLVFGVSRCRPTCPTTIRPLPSGFDVK